MPRWNERKRPLRETQLSYLYPDCPAEVGGIAGSSDWHRRFHFRRSSAGEGAARPARPTGVDRGSGRDHRRRTLAPFRGPPLAADQESDLRALQRTGPTPAQPGIGPFRFPDSFQEVTGARL